MLYFYEGEEGSFEDPGDPDITSQPDIPRTSPNFRPAAAHSKGEKSKHSDKFARSQPPPTASSQLPSTASSQLPSTASSELPSTASSQLPSTSWSQPSSTAWTSGERRGEVSQAKWPPQEVAQSLVADPDPTEGLAPPPPPLLPSAVHPHPPEHRHKQLQQQQQQRQKKQQQQQLKKQKHLHLKQEQLGEDGEHALNKTLNARHPVTALHELCCRMQYEKPYFSQRLVEGSWAFDVKVNGVEYCSPFVRPNKKDARSDAAKYCLRKLGILKYK